MTLPSPVPGTARRRALTRILALLGLGALFVIHLLREPPEGLELAGHRALGVFGLCVALWVSSLLPLVITSILALVLLPLLGVMDEATTFALFGNRAVFFVLGAFILASGVVRSGLSRRLALAALWRFGTSPRKLLVVSFLLPLGLSFMISEHAVAAMMFPIVGTVCAVLGLEPARSPLGRDLFLVSAHGCVIGGAATLLGGARGPLALGILADRYGESVGFTTWILATLPIVIGLTLLVLLRLRWSHRKDVVDLSPVRAALRDQRSRQGRPERREIAIGLLLLFTVIAWALFGEQVGLATIALLAVVAGFVLGLMRWHEVEEDVNWGIFLMYGGAVALGHALAASGAVSWVGERLLLGVELSPQDFILLVSAVAILLTEAVSNSAVVAVLLPLAFAIGADMGMPPRMIALTVAIPTGLAFVLPMSTPAVALARGSGFVRGRDLLRTGLPLSLTGWILLNLCVRYWWPKLGLGM